MSQAAEGRRGSGREHQAQRFGERAAPQPQRAGSAFSPSPGRSDAASSLLVPAAQAPRSCSRSLAPPPAPGASRQEMKRVTSELGDVLAVSAASKPNAPTVTWCRNSEDGFVQGEAVCCTGKKEISRVTGRRRRSSLQPRSSCSSRAAQPKLLFFKRPAYPQYGVRRLGHEEISWRFVYRWHCTTGSCWGRVDIRKGSGACNHCLFSLDCQCLYITIINTSK